MESREAAVAICEGLTDLDLDRLGKNLWRFLSAFEPDWRQSVIPQWSMEVFARLLEKALEALDRQSLVQVIGEGPYTIIGPLEAHGDSLVSLLSIIPSIVDRKVIFLGNYFGLGFASLEVFAFVLVLKCRYPNNIFLLRGAHEDKSALDSLGLQTWMEQRFTVPEDDDRVEDIHDLLEELLSELSLVALLANNVVCMFGAPGPTLLKHGLKLLYGLEKGEPRTVLEAKAITECLWTCINSEETNREICMPSTSAQLIEKFCSRKNISLLIRGRQMVAKGALCYPKRTLTLTSSLCYVDQYINDAAAISIDGKRIKIHQIHMKEEEQKTLDLVKLGPGKNAL